MQTEIGKTGRGLTPRQLELLRAIARFQAERCYSPTIGELASERGISRSTTFEHIIELRRKGLLSARAGRARSLKLTSKARGLLDSGRQGGRGSSELPPAGIPLAGRVAAGLPIEAVEQRECLSLAGHFGGPDDVFALEVAGHSMIDAGIRDGDYVICRRSAVADEGQLVIAVVDNENATLKRFYREKERVRLEPANRAYGAIYSDDCRIEAVVLGLIRKF